MTTNIFYVYEHVRPDTGVCFYVGKGKGKRAWNMKDRNAHHRAIQSKLKAKIAAAAMGNKRTLGRVQSEEERALRRSIKSRWWENLSDKKRAAMSEKMAAGRKKKNSG